MAIEKWIDDLAAVSGSIQSHTGGQIKAFRAFTRNEIPEALTTFPAALTYPTRMVPNYSDSGPCYDLWEGVVEYHLMGNTAKGNLPELMRYFGKIRSAFAAHRQLGGKVAYLVIVEPGLELITGQYGEEAEHHGILCHWVVKDIVSSEVTLGL